MFTFIDGVKIEAPEGEIFPHCDPRVLHAPGQCRICDEYAPKAQKDRVRRMINFTGESTRGLQPCPSDQARGVGGAHVWHGNTPKKPPIRAAEPPAGFTRRRYDPAASQPNEDQEDRSCGLTFRDLKVALKNVGIDAECGACMEIFFTGCTTNEHTHKAP